MRMPNYVNNPDNHGKFISSIELQKLNPYKVMPPVLISDWMKKDLWSRREAVQLLAGCLPSQSGLDITAPRNYLDKTDDYHLLYGDAPPKGWPDNIDPFGDYPRLKHPLREELTQNLCTLISWITHCDLDETKPPKEWIDWADKKGFKPYWLEYATTIQSAPAADAEAMQNITPTAKPGITKSAVINAFEGMLFDCDKWGKHLASPPNWLKDCRVTPGKKGSKVSATWNPVHIAVALFDKQIPIKKLDAVFVSLNDWADEWREASASFR